MNKKLWTAAVVAAACLIAAACAYGQDDMTHADDPGFTAHARPLPLFPHDGHNEKAGIDDCSVCHHVYENGVKSDAETSEDQSCSSCHMKDGNTRPLRRAFHDRCKGCHEEQKKGPVQCAECHRKPQ